jgi:hypothetical protein
VSYTHKLILLLAVLLCIFVFGGFVAGRFFSTDSSVLTTLREENEVLKEKLTEAQMMIADLRERNASLSSDIEGGRSIEEEHKALETQKIELDRRDERLTVLEQELSAREANLLKEENEFYQATNMTQQEIGEAKRIIAEYDEMKIARDDAQATASRWLTYLWLGSAFVLLALLGLAVAVMRHMSISARYRAEMERHKHMFVLLETTLRSSPQPAEVAAIMSAMRASAGLPYNDED